MLLQQVVEPNTHFVERESASVDSLKAFLSKDHRLVISGLPGMGKTELASQFVQRARGRDYKGIFWLNVDTETSFQSGVREMARVLTVGKDESKFSDVARSVMNELNKQDNWLMVFDNLDQVDVIKGFLPEKRGSRHVLITTRYRQAHLQLSAAQIHLEGMSETEAVELLLAASQQREVERGLNSAASLLVNEVGLLPLAIIQAAAYLQETQDELSSYIEIYKASKADIWDWSPTQDTSYVSVATVMSIAFQKFQHLGATVRLFCLICFLDPENVPDLLWTDDTRFRDETLRQVFAKKAYLNKALQPLLAYGLVQRDPQTRGLSIHRLVQSVMREILDGSLTGVGVVLTDLCQSEKSPNYWIERIIEILNIGYYSLEGTKKNIPVSNTLNPHVSISIEYCDKYSVVTEDLGELLFKAAQLARSRGDHRTECKLFERCVRTKEAVFGIGHINSAIPINNLGVAYHELGKQGQSIIQFTKALTIQEKEHGKGHINTAITLGNFGLPYQALGRYGDAIEHYRRMLEIQEREYGKDHPKTAETFRFLGTLYGDQHKFDQSLTYCLRALRILEREYGPDNYTVGFNAGFVGLAYFRLNQVDEATVYYKQALRIIEETQGTGHPAVAWYLQDLARCAVKKKDHQSARALLSRAVKILEDHYGDQPEISIFQAFLGLASSYRATRSSDEAVSFAGKALRIAEGLKDDISATAAHKFRYINGPLRNLSDLSAALHHFRERVSTMATAPDEPLKQAFKQLRAILTKIERENPDETITSRQVVALISMLTLGSQYIRIEALP
jgi:tetratricopeptide (TPR) repeat protein